MIATLISLNYLQPFVELPGPDTQMRGVRFGGRHQGKTGDPVSKSYVIVLIVESGG